MIFFCFYPVLATTNKRKHALEQQQQQRTYEKTTALEQQEKQTSLMIADPSHNKNEELGYLCVCARARVYLSNA
jgi:hypothetical protein